MADESQRVAELLDHVQKGDERRFKDFCEALAASDQPLVVNMLCGNQTDGGDRTDAVPHDADDMPLSRQNSCKLTACWNFLIDRMTGPGLMAQLEAREVFSDLQMKKLKASKDMLYMLSRSKSVSGVFCIITCLDPITLWDVWDMLPNFRGHGHGD